MKQSKMVVLTGAGISAESGIPTFRDSGGLWEREPIDVVATPEGFMREPKRVIEFYDGLRQKVKACEPNPAHKALVDLEKKFGDDFLLITQNVDDLHQRAGSKRIIPMHGELFKVRCQGSQTHVIHCYESQPPKCPVCSAKMRPHIVWFGEVPHRMNEIQAALLSCTTFAYIGTSSQVYPAAGFKQIASQCGAKVVCLNLDAEPDPWTDETHKGYAGEMVPKWVNSFT